MRRVKYVFTFFELGSNAPKLITITAGSIWEATEKLHNRYFGCRVKSIQVEKG